MNIAKSGLGKYIHLHHADARDYLKTQADESYNFIFLDAERPQYMSYWEDLDRTLRRGSLLVVDNALSPHPEELVEFLKTFDATNRFLTQVLNIGNGEFLALKLHD
jgi:predicted O-methyltransferase YrrM